MVSCDGFIDRSLVEVIARSQEGCDLPNSCQEVFLGSSLRELSQSHKATGLQAEQHAIDVDHTSQGPASGSPLANQA